MDTKKLARTERLFRSKALASNPRIIKIFINCILFCISFFALERFCHEKTHGFRLHKIQSNLSYRPEWEIHPFLETEKNQILEKLSQPYFFLNSGGECYVFLSKDGKYVLKFFKHHHMRPHHWTDFFLPKTFQKQRIKRLKTLFSSCKLAYERFRKETGLIYLHLNKTDDLHLRLKLFDPIGVVHSISLDQYTFALQKKASMAYATIDNLLEAKEFHAAEVRLASLTDLILTRCKAGLADHDPRKRNFGFVGEKAIEIDLGSFSLNEHLKEHEQMKKVFQREAFKLQSWIKKYHPELLEFLEKKIQEKLNENL